MGPHALETPSGGKAEVSGEGLGDDEEWVARPVVTDDVIPSEKVVVGMNGLMGPSGGDFPAMEMAVEVGAGGDFQDGVVVARLECGLGLVQMVVVTGAPRVEAGDVMDSTGLDRVCGHDLADGLLVEAFCENEVDDGLFAAIGSFAVAFLEAIGELDDGSSPPSIAFAPSVRGDGFPSETVEERCIDEVVEGSDAVSCTGGFSEEANTEDEEVAKDRHRDDDSHQEESCGSFFEGAEHWRRWTWIGGDG